LFLLINFSTIFSQELVKNIEPGAGSSYPTNLYPFKNKLIFWAYTNYNGYQMYITDGTSTSTTMLTNIPNTTPTNPSPGTSIQDKFIQIDSLGFFYVITSTSGSSITRLNIYRTNGTVDGTYRLTIDGEIIDNGLGTINFFKLNGMICNFCYRA
jgi:ELWxxDGT repeat protein